jgi:hypothetical protein
MGDDRLRHERARPAGSLCAQAEIDFLEIQEVALVERADAIEDFARQTTSRPMRCSAERQRCIIAGLTTGTRRPSDSRKIISYL